MPSKILVGDCREMLRTLPDGYCQMCITSPPYYGLRDYNNDSQIGLEDSIGAYVENLVDIFREVKRVLRDDATLWLNLGDSFARSGGWSNNNGLDDLPRCESRRAMTNIPNDGSASQKLAPGLKAKDLIGVPWRVAFALQADGWYLRSDIIWAKGVSGQKGIEDQLLSALADEDLTEEQIERIMGKFDLYVGNPMPESCRDRPSSAHEHIFLLSKQPKYYYDQHAVKEPSTGRPSGNKKRRMPEDVGRPDDHLGSGVPYKPDGSGRNIRNVWTIPTKGFKGAHFAVYPEALIETPILAGTSAYGCCAECGAPYERIVQRGNSEHHCRPGCGCGRGEKTGDQTKQDWSENWKGYGGFSGTSVDTGEWEPTCDCGSHMMPCTVIDPFFGSGTTGVVCERFGREYIGIELNPKYAEIAKKRLKYEEPEIDEI